MVSLILLQTLRMFSFMLTLLPSSSYQCEYKPTPEMLSGTLLPFTIGGEAPEAGNKYDWNPPKDVTEVFTRVDATTGCGDVMFNAKTIWCLISLLIIWTYYPYRSMKFAFCCAICAFIPLTLASRKVYSVVSIRNFECFLSRLFLNEVTLNSPFFILLGTSPNLRRICLPHFMSSPQFTSFSE